MYVKLYISIFYTEILEALSSSSMPIMTTIFTNSTTTTTISQQFTRSTAVHHTSSVSSVKPTKTHGSNITQSPQGLLKHGLFIIVVTVEEYRLAK